MFQPQMPYPGAEKPAGAPGHKRSVLVVGNYRPTIPLARELRDCGYRIIAGITDAPERGYATSRSISELWEHPDPEFHFSEFLDALNNFVTERPDIVHVVPVAEELLLRINAHRGDLCRASCYAMSDKKTIDLCLDKGRMASLAKSLDVAQAPFRIVETVEDLRDAAENLGGSVVVRPMESRLKFGTNKVLLCETAAELERLLPDWPAGHLRLIVQARAVGRRHNVYFAARAGHLYRLLETVADRTDRADGTGLAVAGRTVDPSPTLRSATESLVGAMNYSGIGCAQFLVDPESGRTSFLEINPRIAGNHAVPVAAGLGLGPELLALNRGGCSGDMRIGRPGLRYVWSYGDLGGLVREISHRRLGSTMALRWAGHALVDALRADLHMTWSWRDPIPALASVFDKARDIAIKLVRPSRRPSARQVAALEDTP